MSEGIRQQLAEAIHARPLERLHEPADDCRECGRIIDNILAVLGVSAEEWDNAPTTRIAHGPDEDQDVAALAYLLAGTFGDYLEPGVYRLTRVKEEDA